MTALLGAVLVASLAGSLHCAGMCGPLVAFYAGADASRGSARGLAHAVYNGGRLLGYLALGAIAGALGGALDLAGSLAGIQRLAAPLAGALMILWGVGAILHLKGVRVLPAGSRDGSLATIVRAAFGRVGRRPPVVRALAVGLLSALLPCGWLWAFVLAAAGAGTPVAGAAVMAAFWLGTVPILLAVGLGAQAAALPFRRHAPLLTAVLLVVIGVVAIVRRPDTTLSIFSKVEAKAAATAEQVDSLDAGEMPCCGDEGE
jgi:sulfite exporter TauE/SafE